MYFPVNGGFSRVNGEESRVGRRATTNISGDAPKFRDHFGNALLQTHNANLFFFNALRSLCDAERLKKAEGDSNVVTRNVCNA
ncbi:MAG TPA: hypothetical protein DHV29_03100 [Bacteroidales bacterium]|nr:MAG: hypothetical protein A2W94_02590 [Bacteroidetes bacterium GWE2_42_42]HBG70038.1 hypothetical protein [Bacteroidales bacterium]HCB62356.1 hypothetical protein [Bacteroidales bacterium]HCY22457.1 hypothetical protein [Bacteroidales bacterium]